MNKINLVKRVSGILGISNGGTGLSSLSGQQGKFLKVKATEDGFEFDTSAGGDLTVNNSTTNTTLTIAGDSNNFYNITGQSSAITLANPSGTKVEGKRFIIRIKSDATPRAITYGSEWQAIGVTLPTTTVANKITAIGGIINSTTSKVEVWAVNQEQ